MKAFPSPWTHARRPTAPDPLAHPRRRRIHAYVQANPGATFREVARGAQVATGTTRHHLTVLKRHGVLVERAHGSTTRFFENHGRYDATWASVVLLREAPLRELHGWVAANPEVPQKAILEAMAAAGWSRSTTQHRLRRLVTGGALAFRLQGRHKIYRPGPTVPPTLPAGPVPPAAAPGDFTLLPQPA